jgi:hypothetical protein
VCLLQTDTLADDNFDAESIRPGEMAHPRLQK